MRDGSGKRIRLHNRDLRVMAADSWHQPDGTERRFYPITGKESNETSERKFPIVEPCDREYPRNDTDRVSIHTLNDDCLRHVFLFLPIVDRVRVEIGECFVPRTVRVYRLLSPRERERERRIFDGVPMLRLQFANVGEI